MIKNFFEKNRAISYPIAFITLGLLVFLGYQSNKNYNQSQEIKSACINEEMAYVPAEPNYLYGIMIDSLEVEEGFVERDQNLSAILSLYNVPISTVSLLAQNARDIFDVRKIAARRKFTVMHSKDSLKTARHFVYEPNAFEYVVFNICDSCGAYKQYRKIDTVQSTISGVITSSMYETLINNGASPELAVALANVYAWEIDFLAIQKKR